MNNGFIITYTTKYGELMELEFDFDNKLTIEENYQDLFNAVLNQAEKDEIKEIVNVECCIDWSSIE